MSALYDFLPVPPKGNDESGSHLYPKLRPYKTVSFDELTEKIASTRLFLLMNLQKRLPPIPD